MSALNLVNAKALQSFIRTYHTQFLSLLYSNFETSKYVTHHAMTKGDKILTQIIIGDIVKRWKKTFDPTADAVDFKPRTLSTELVKADLEIYPQDFFETYLGQIYQGAIEPNKVPFFQEIFNQILLKIASEQENAAWWGDAAAVPADDDTLAEVVDGFGTIAKAEATAGNITAVATGALSSSTAVAGVESVYKALDADIRRGEMIGIFMSNALKVKYLENYRTSYGAMNLTKDYMQFDLDSNAKIIEIPGSTDFIMATPMKNLHYGYQLPGDEMFRFQDDMRSIKCAMDFRVGFQFGIVDNKILRINNQ
ncbi:MAG: hypothetical protein IPN68_17855 [Bacteroidetes bacterium]|nr:hypothetical protein [Bacteroidota bacterium]